MRTLFLLLCGLSVTAPLPAQLTTHTWPFGVNEAVASDKFDVFVTLGAGPEQKLDVIMSNAIHEGDWRAVELAGRTFSFASLDYDPTGGSLTFRVVKRFGGASTSVEVQPRNYAVTPALTGGTQAVFTIHATERYLSVNFKGPDNETTPNKWISHMLCIYIDPPEADRPDPAGAGVVPYTSTTPGASLSNATTIYFAAGHHNLRAYSGGTGPINDGILTVAHQQRVYFASGAFVDGLIATANTQTDRNQKLYGRGILSGRLFPWYNKPGYNGPRYQQIVRLAQDLVIDGITIMESPSHGIVGGNRAKITHTKYLGWHSNNDAVRTGGGSEIAHTFIRAVDDHFYNFDIWAHDCVLWAGHNGAILTYGWGGLAGDNTYNAGSSLLENIDIIHPEWIGLGNNNSLVAAQTGCDFKPWGYNGATLTVLRNIRIDGLIPGIVNIKPRSESNGSVSAVQVPLASVGYLGDLLVQNVTADGFFAKARIKGKLDASTTGGATYYARNIQFDNLTVGGTPVTATNAATYFDIETATTSEVFFTASGADQAQARYDLEGNTADTFGVLHGTAAGSLSYVTGTVGAQAIHFDGTTAFITAPRTIHDHFTIQCWVRTTATGGSGVWTSGAGIVDASIAGSGIDFGTAVVGGHFAFGVGNPDTTLCSRTTVNDGAWHHVAATRDATTGEMRVYIDGLLEAATTGPTGVRGNTSTLRIGGLLQGGGLLVGDIDDVRLHSRVLTPRELFAIGGTIHSPTGLSGLPQPDGSIRLTWTDNSTNETSFTIQRAATSNGPWTTLPTALTDATSHTDHGLAGGVVYQYRIRADNEVGESPWSGAFVSLSPQAVASTRLVNFSCRLHVEAGETVIPGFVLGGGTTILVRAIGPSLVPFGVSGAMPDPELTLYVGGTAIDSNDNWDAATIGTTFADTGAFSLPSGSLDAALVAFAQPGLRYTVHVRGRAPSSAGIVLIEIYTIDKSANASGFANASIRAPSRLGDRVLILGFVLEGARQQPLLIRGIGPTLAAFGVAGTLPDPRLTLRDAVPHVLLRSDNWRQADGLTGLFAQLGAFVLPFESLDAAVLAGLRSGVYTVAADDPTGETGETLVELYVAP